MIIENVRFGRSCPGYYNANILVGLKNDKVIPQMLWFDEPGEYKATYITNPEELPKGFEEVARFQKFLDVYSANGHVAMFEADEIVVYRRGHKECCILEIWNYP